ncbi:hypothetical protein RD792_004708 [Penstemon davidsonii]|uniref:Transferase, transferring glycosyl groups n=1 Tax=Penstemon davidsonii TaxID=160366 RepID=A0ABR0DJG6_9LAMI|nr:hypothetical protein RD792_004708 [Penstemon davidsonii]
MAEFSNFPKTTIYIFLLSINLSATFLIFFTRLAASEPVPTTWPLQFHSILYINTSKGVNQVVDLWYDWPNGRNFNIIQKQLGEKLYDLEWNNGTSYYYTLDANKKCTVTHFPVGILRPNFLDGAKYLGKVNRDGFLCNYWEKVDFITYYEDVETKRPVAWNFFSGSRVHVITFEVGKVLDDPNWQAPVYCFGKKKPIIQTESPVLTHLPNLMREFTTTTPLAT